MTLSMFDHRRTAGSPLTVRSNLLVGGRPTAASGRNGRIGRRRPAIYGWSTGRPAGREALAPGRNLELKSGDE